MELFHYDSSLLSAWDGKGHLCQLWQSSEGYGKKYFDFCMSKEARTNLNVVKRAKKQLEPDNTDME
jgi:hypothetical protein